MDNNSVFKVLSSIDVSAHVEIVTTGKASLKYLSWTHAWAGVCKLFPTAVYEVIKQPNGLPYVYDPNTGYMVNTKVTIDGLTHEMWLFVMDGANKAMKAEPYTYKVKDWNASKKEGRTVMIDKVVEAASMFDINKTIMRCLVKNLAMFGYGINIYAGEDLPMTINNISNSERGSLCQSYGESIVLWFEQQNGSITEMSESRIDDIKKWCRSASVSFWRKEANSALMRRMEVDKNFVGPHVSNSIKKHLAGCSEINQCSDSGLLKAYYEYTSSKIGEISANKGE